MPNITSNFIELFANHNKLNESDYSTILSSLSTFFEKIQCNPSSSSSCSSSQQNIITVHTNKICTNTSTNTIEPIQVPSNSTINRIAVSDMILGEMGEISVYTKYTFFAYENIGHIVFRFVQQDTEKLFGILHMYYTHETLPVVLKITDIDKVIFEETFQNRRTNLSMLQSLSYAYYFPGREQGEGEQGEGEGEQGEGEQGEGEGEGEESYPTNVQLKVVYYQLIFTVLLRLMDKKCTYNTLGNLKNAMESSVVLAEIFNGMHDTQTLAATFFSSVNKNINYKQKWTVYHLLKKDNEDHPGKLSFIHCDCLQSIHTFFHFQFQALEFYRPEEDTLRATFYLQSVIFQDNTNETVYGTQLDHVLSCISQLSNPNEFTPSKINLLKENSLGTVVYECGIVRIQSKTSVTNQLYNQYHQIYFLFLLSTDRVVGIFDFFSVNEFQSSEFIAETKQNSLYNVQIYR